MIIIFVSKQNKKMKEDDNIKEILVSGNSLPDAYHKALVSLENNGLTVDCPDYNMTQKECSMTIFVKNPLQEPRVSKLMFGGAYDLEKYLMEMIDGISDCFIGKTRSYPYTYHSRFAPYLNFVVEELERNPQSRRAIISTRNNKIDSKSIDPPCLSQLQFFIRNGKLDLEVVFRSNDLVKAYFFNSFALIRLQEIIAEQLNIPVGTYSHRANSCHCYERDFDLLNGMAKRIKEAKCPEKDLCWSYENYYKELMIEEIPKINEQLQELKRRYIIE